ncbi:MAG TPA: hypothetical protein PKV55_05455 [Nitrospira sp.]|jgi:hypothetical protein|nr:hypothetical protein [Nitrospira sp.]MBS0163012.1 hypothetical protein [Nitrospira sp.]MBS0175143.1 hypothetical protein [Nitrospira sp.]MBS0179464.1 hypothetical protein [Nitrospira sp.]MBX3336687.1 hypothetical protein [Nitrospira sp.]
MNRFIYLRPHKRQRMTVSLPAELLERMRDAAYWTSGTTMAGLISSAMEDLLHNLETQNGRPFSPRLQDLKPGRPRANKAIHTPVSENIQSVSG